MVLSAVLEEQQDNVDVVGKQVVGHWHHRQDRGILIHGIS
jgi:hypothetical protein